MATYTYPYPAHTANRAANWIAFEGRDLLQYFTPRGDPNPVYDRFVGYLDVDWNAVNRETVEEPNDLVPVEETIETVAPVAPVVPAVNVAVPTPAANEPSRQRDGNDLVLVYPNGSQERYRNYFAPAAGTTVPTGNFATNPNDNLPGTEYPWLALPENVQPLKTLSTRTQVGNDLVHTFTDGSQRIFPNFFLPRIPNPAAYLNGDYAFAFEWKRDPELLIRYGINPGKPWLSSDFIEPGGDRVAVYSDGSAIRVPNWVQNNPQFAPAAPSVGTILDDTDVIDYVTPADLFTPGDGQTEVVTPVTPEVVISTPFPNTPATSGVLNTSPLTPAQTFPVNPQVLPGPGNVNVPAQTGNQTPPPDYTILALALIALSLVR